MMEDIPLRRVSLRIHETDVVVDVADPLQFVGVAVMVRTAFGSDLRALSQHKSHVNKSSLSPRLTKKIVTCAHPNPNKSSSNSSISVASPSSNSNNLNIGVSGPACHPYTG